MIISILLLCAFLCATSVERNVSVSGSAVDVTLHINLSQGTTAIIISEHLPKNSGLISSSPSISKSEGNEIKWLLHGDSISTKQINYSYSAQNTSLMPAGTWETVQEYGATTHIQHEDIANETQTTEKQETEFAINDFLSYSALAFILLIASAIAYWKLRPKKV